MTTPQNLKYGILGASVVGLAYTALSVDLSRKLNVDSPDFEGKTGVSVSEAKWHYGLSVTMLIIFVLALAYLGYDMMTPKGAKMRLGSMFNS